MCTATESAGLAHPKAETNIEKVTTILRSGFFKNTIAHELDFSFLKFGAKVHLFLTRKIVLKNIFVDFPEKKRIYCYLCNKLVLKWLVIVKTKVKTDWSSFLKHPDGHNSLNGQKDGEHSKKIGLFELDVRMMRLQDRM